LQSSQENFPHLGYSQYKPVAFSYPHASHQRVPQKSHLNGLGAHLSQVVRPHSLHFPTTSQAAHDERRHLRHRGAWQSPQQASPPQKPQIFHGSSTRGGRPSGAHSMYPRVHGRHALPPHAQSAAFASSCPHAAAEAAAIG
jgi:hypothetical protein